MACTRLIKHSPKYVRETVAEQNLKGDWLIEPINHPEGLYSWVTAKDESAMNKLEAITDSIKITKNKMPHPSPPQRFVITLIAYRECGEHVTLQEVEDWIMRELEGSDMNRIEHVHVREVDAVNANGRDLADL